MRAPRDLHRILGEDRVDRQPDQLLQLGLGNQHPIKRIVVMRWQLADYSYDNVGNRTQMTSTLSAIPGGQFFYDANDRLTSDMYDANGNTISSSGISFAYNFQNQLVQSGGLTAGYDGDGNRVYETVGGTITQYLIDTLNPTGLPQVMDELQNGSVTRTYAYGLERISENQLIGGTWTPSFYGYDGHGSTRFLTNMVGTVTDTYNYDAFGSVISSTGSTPNEFLFAGEQSDPALGFYYMRARYYRPATGRFWAPDPIEGRFCCGMSWNPYPYVLDNPVNPEDPSGEGFAQRIVASIVAASLLITGPAEEAVMPHIPIEEIEYILEDAARAVRT